MFSFLKNLRKPAHEKYGRDNYILDKSNYVTDDNWILALSSVFVETLNIELRKKISQHDLVEIFPKEFIPDKIDMEMIEEYCDFTTSQRIEKRIKHLYNIDPNYLESDLYACVNLKTKQEIIEYTQKQYDKDDEYEYYEMCIHVGNNQEKFAKLHFRIGFIAESMWQVRLALYFKVINETQAWAYLRDLANLARPIMTIFKSWEVYNQNIKYFSEIYYCDDDNNLFIDMPEAISCLDINEHSPLHSMPIDLGVDKTYPYNVKSHSLKFAEITDIYDNELLLELRKLFDTTDKAPLWDALNNLNEMDREYWYPLFLGKFNKNYFDEEDLIELPELYPNVYYAHHFRAVYFIALAWEARGHGTSQDVGEENYNLFHERLNLALQDLAKAYELAPNETTVWADIYDVLSLTGSDDETADFFYNLIETKAINDPYCIRTISNYKQKRWGGSHQENIDWANQVIAGSNRGDACRLIIFEVALERYGYICSFDDNEEKALKIFKDEELKDEVNQYFDELVENMNKAPYRIAQVLTYWYVKVNDIQRLRRVAQTMKAGHYNVSAAMNDDYYELQTNEWMNWIRSI